MVKKDSNVLVVVIMLLVVGISIFFALKPLNNEVREVKTVEKFVVQNVSCDYSLLNEKIVFLEAKIKVLEKEKEYLGWKLNESSLQTEYVDLIKKQGVFDDLDTQISMSGFSGIRAEFNRPVYLLKTNTNFYQLCTSNSMSPTFDCKTTLVVYKPKPDELRIGDIVMFPGDTKEEVEPGIFRTWGSSSDFVTHRIVKISGDLLTTKGDNNPWADDVRINKTKVVYKVWQ